MVYLLIFCNIIMVLVFIWRYPTLPPQIPLFLSKPWGEDQLAELWMIFLLPLLSVIFYCVNNFLINKFFPKNYFVTKLNHYLNLLTLAITFIMFIKIVLFMS